MPKIINDFFTSCEDALQNEKHIFKYNLLAFLRRFPKHATGGIKYLKFTWRSRVAIFTGKKKTALLQITGLVVKFEITIRGKHRDDINIKLHKLHEEFHCTAIRTFSTF